MWGGGEGAECYIQEGWGFAFSLGVDPGMNIPKIKQKTKVAITLQFLTNMLKEI